MSDLDILPPDEAVFHKAEKKGSSNKQKEHLIKARAKARETIERRRMLDKQAKENKIEEEPEIEGEGFSKKMEDGRWMPCEKSEGLEGKRLSLKRESEVIKKLADPK